MAELKPCPFCSSNDVYMTKDYPFFIYCLNCGMITRLSGKPFEKDIPELTKIWNTRTPQKEQVKCIDCEYLDFEVPYAVCSKAYKGIVSPDDSCGKGKRRTQKDG